MNNHPTPTATRSTLPPPGEDDPAIVVAKQNNALQIYALDDAAARLGLEIGLPLANARAICPHIKVFDADPAADHKTLNDIADWCDRFTPLVALDAPHGLFLDITGCAHLFGGEAALMQTICAALTLARICRQRRASPALRSARVPFAAMSMAALSLPARKPDAVRPLPLFALGADDAIIRGLRRAGLKTIGDVASRERHEITARFGARFHDLAGAMRWARAMRRSARASRCRITSWKNVLPSRFRRKK